MESDQPRVSGAGKHLMVWLTRNNRKKELSTKTHEERRRATGKDNVVDPLKGNAPWVRMRENAASRLPVQQPLVLLILCILCIHVQQVGNRINGTGSLLPR